MIELASPKIRRIIVVAKSRAILGEVQAALELLDSEVSNCSPLIDRIVLLISACDILHLCFRDEEAIQLYDDKVIALLSTQPESIKIVAAYNRRDILDTLFRSGDLYGLVDRSRIGSVNLWDYENYFDVAEARERNTRYESLAKAWQELVRCYYQGCWRASRLAARLISIEYIELGRFQDAIYHVVVCEDNKVAEKLGKLILQYCTPPQITILIRKWMSVTNMGRLFVAGCDILDSFSDAVPDEVIGDVFEQLLLNISSESDAVVVSRAWVSIEKIAWRLTHEQAERLAHETLRHPVWTTAVESGRIVPVREHIMKALAICAPNLSLNSTKSIAEGLFSIVAETNRDTDRSIATNLLCALAKSGGPEVTALVKERMYIPGRPLDAHLIYVAPELGVTFGKLGQFDNYAKDLARWIRKQVQVVELGGEVESVSESYLHLTVVKNGEKLVINFISTSNVQAILKHRSQLSPDAFQELLDAILTMIRTEDNVISNKVLMVQTLTHVGDICNEKQAKEIFQTIEPFANGEIKEPSYLMSWAESQNPLNPYKVNTGNPADLRCVAILTLAHIERDNPGIFSSKLNKVVATALMHDDPKVRAFAIASARERLSLSDAEFNAILLATRDAEPSVVVSAFGALGSKRNLKLKRPQWRLLLHSSKIASKSISVEIRRSVAFACCHLRPFINEKSIAIEIDELITTLSGDKCASVRQSVVRHQNLKR